MFLQSFERSDDVKVSDVSDETHSSRMMEEADQARKDETLCDVTLLIGPGKYPIKAHRLVLTLASGFFRAMFTSKFKEASQDTVALPQMDRDTMETIMNFIYTGKLAISNKNIENIAQAANFLEMPKLLEECSGYLTQRTDYDNCIEVLEFADHIGNDELKTQTKDYFVKNFDKVSSKSLDIMDMSIPLLLEIIGDDSTAVDSDPCENEERLLQFGLNRLQSEPEDVFRKYISQLLNMVHLPKVSDKFLNSLTKKVDNCQEAKEIIDKAKDRKKSMQPSSEYCPEIDDFRWDMGRFQGSGTMSIVYMNVNCDPSDDVFFGEPVFVAGMPFCVGAQIWTHTDDGPPVKYMGAYVYCLEDLESKRVTIPSMEFEIVSPRKPIVNFSEQIDDVIFSDVTSSNWGVSELIQLRSLLWKHYYDEDSDSCTIIAHIKDVKTETIDE